MLSLQDIIIESPRLILRPFCIEDAQDYHNIVKNVDTMKFIDWGPLKNFDETLNKVTSIIQQYKNGHCEWVIVHKKHNRVIGSIVIYNATVKDIEIAYIISKQYWNMGYATEAVTALTDFLLSNKNVLSIYAKHAIENPASGQVLIKSGFKIVGVLYKSFKMKSGKIVDCIQYQKNKRLVACVSQSSTSTNASRGIYYRLKIEARARPFPVGSLQRFSPGVPPGIALQRLPIGNPQSGQSRAAGERLERSEQYFKHG